MPVYEQIIFTIPKLPSSGLAGLFRGYGKEVLTNGGNFRGLMNHGIRPLPELARR